MKSVVNKIDILEDDLHQQTLEQVGDFTKRKYCFYRMSKREEYVFILYPKLENNPSKESKIEVARFFIERIIRKQVYEINNR